MKKMLFILAFLCSLVAMNAQTLYYVQSGSNPKSSSTICKVVYFNSNDSRVWIDEYTNVVGQARTNLANNSSYYDEKGYQGVTNESTISMFGISSKSYFQFSSSTTKAHLYKRDMYSGMVLTSFLRTDYIAFSKDWKTLILRPMSDNPEYYVRVNKSVLEESAANIDDLF